MLWIRITKDTQAVDVCQALQRVGRELGLVVGDALHADAFQGLHRRGQSHRAYHIGCPRFVPIWRIGPANAIERDALNRTTAAILRLAPFECVASADQGTGAERRVPLVS